MKKIYDVGCLILLGVGLAACLPEKKKEDTTNGACPLGAFKEDATIKDSFKIGDDPAGIAIEPKNDQIKVEEVLNQYAKAHKCTLSGLSVRKLTNGLLKGIKGMEQFGGSEMMPNQSDNYIMVGGEVAHCVKVLKLNLPIEDFKGNK